MALLGFADSSGVCADCALPCWYDSNHKCLPGPLRISLPPMGFSSDRGYAVDFAGRGKSGLLISGCPGDAYVSIGSNNSNEYACDGTSEPYFGNIGIATIDVFKALRDGIWSSSVNIDIYYVKTGAADGSTRLVRATPSAIVTTDPAGACNCVEKRFTTQVVAALTCANATTIQATITVYDDGTLSIA